MKKLKAHLTGKNILKVIMWVIVGIFIACAFALLFALAVQYLWNWLMPEIFGLATITFWQAFGITVLAKLLFGGFGHHGHKGDEHHRKFHSKFKEGNGYHVPHEKVKEYEKFWESEGRQAFDDFLERSEKE